MKTEYWAMNVGPRLRMLRQSMGIPLRELAERTGFSVSFLSLVENDKASPSVGSLERMAAAFGLSLAEFFQGAEELPYQILRAGERQSYTSEWSQTVVELLAQRPKGGALLPLILRMAPGGRSGKTPRVGLAEEFVLVMEGNVWLTTEEREEELKAGDSLWLPAGVGRMWQNRDEAPVVLLVVGHRSSSVELAGPAEPSEINRESTTF
jgi:transcriptional regulator with XRE-family HTH domain